MVEIQKADPAARRMPLIIVGCGTLIGVVLITMAGRFQPGVRAWVEKDVDARLRMVSAALTLLTTGPALGAAGYLWLLGGRVARAERYPSPGLRMMRDTPVVVGQDAVRRGRLLQTLAAVVGVAGLLLALFLWRLLLLAGTGNTAMGVSR